VYYYRAGNTLLTVILLRDNWMKVYRLSLYLRKMKPGTLIKKTQKYKHTYLRKSQLSLLVGFVRCLLIRGSVLCTHAAIFQHKQMHCWLSCSLYIGQGPEAETTFHYCWRLKSSFKPVWMESIYSCNSPIGYFWKWRCCSLVCQNLLDKIRFWPSIFLFAVVNRGF
jgi:hypothetical protein